MYKYLVLFLVACAGVPHVPPQPRNPYEQSATVVKVESRCSDWGEVHEGTGVIISERYVLTAQHVVRCNDIPSVRVYLREGDKHRVVVVKEDREQDIAKLEIAHAGTFGLDIAPPMLSPDPKLDPGINDWVCIYPYGQSECYQRLSTLLIAGRRHQGDSGSPVYDGSYLLGLVTHDVPRLNATQITIVTSEWLEGT